MKFYCMLDLLSIKPPGREPATGSTPKQYKDRMIAALTRHLLDIASQQPLVVVLADAHWIDSSTLELVDQIIRSIKAARVLLVIESRQEFCPRWVNKSHVTTLLLDRLGQDESRAIISHVARGKELPAKDPRTNCQQNRRGSFVCRGTHYERIGIRIG